jgi:SAM-dependent methyltransferase
MRPTVLGRQGSRKVPPGALADRHGRTRSKEQAMTAVADLKRTHRGIWAAGDYAAVAELIDDAPPRDALARAGIVPGAHVLDVATGTGNLAIRAAAAGAQVTGLDLTPELFEVARHRAQNAAVAIDWVEGDAEELPFEDASYDVVLSAFGVQFAPRHEVVARELVRVTRPGGRIVLVNWSPAGHIGELLKIIGGYMPAPPAFASPPPLWGSEQHVRRLFADSAVELEFARGYNPWRFDSPEAFVAFMETRYGPMLKARERLTETSDWDECRAAIVDMVTRRNDSPTGGLLMNAEYLVTVGRRLR